MQPGAAGVMKIYSCNKQNVTLVDLKWRTYRTSDTTCVERTDWTRIDDIFVCLPCYDNIPYDLTVTGFSQAVELESDFTLKVCLFFCSLIYVIHHSNLNPCYLFNLSTRSLFSPPSWPLLTLSLLLLELCALLLSSMGPRSEPEEWLIPVTLMHTPMRILASPSPPPPPSRSTWSNVRPRETKSVCYLRLILLHFPLTPVVGFVSALESSAIHFDLVVKNFFWFQYYCCIVK